MSFEPSSSPPVSGIPRGIDAAPAPDRARDDARRWPPSESTVESDPAVEYEVDPDQLWSED